MVSKLLGGSEAICPCAPKPLNSRSEPSSGCTPSPVVLAPPPCGVDAPSPPSASALVANPSELPAAPRPRPESGRAASASPLPSRRPFDALLRSLRVACEREEVSRSASEAGGGAHQQFSNRIHGKPSSSISTSNSPLVPSPLSLSSRSRLRRSSTAASSRSRTARFALRASSSIFP